MKKAFYKILLNWYQAADKSLPSWLEKACERNPELALDREEGDELTRALQKRPNEALPSAGDSMASRVLRQITEEDYLAEQREVAPNRLGVWVRAASIAAAAFAVAFALYHFLDTPRSMPTEENGLQVVQVDPEAIQQATQEALELDEDWKNPLDQEIEYIVSDAKGAIDFLASKFVPSSYLKKPEENGKA